MLNRKCIAVTVFVCMASSQVARAAFMFGEFVTYGQETWGVPGSAAPLLRFFFVYPSGGVEVGVSGASGFSMFFTSPTAVQNYIPTIGVNAPLNADLLDPLSTSSGYFGGHLLALQLDVDFADAGFLTGSAGIPFGDLMFVNMMNVSGLDFSALNGLTVRQFLDAANFQIGTGNGVYLFDYMSLLTEELTLAFEGGQPSQFAQDHLQIPEPATGALALLGLLGSRCRARRRRG